MSNKKFLILEGGNNEEHDVSIKSSKETAKGEKLKARLSKGSIEIEVKNVQN